MDPTATTLANYGLAGALAAVVVVLHWHAVYVLIPKMLDTFRAELLLEREHCEKKHGENLVRLDSIKTDATSIREAVVRLEARAKA